MTHQPVGRRRRPAQSTARRREPSLPEQEEHAGRMARRWGLFGLVILIVLVTVLATGYRPGFPVRALGSGAAMIWVALLVRAGVRGPRQEQ